jgi:hypothetical protein
LIFGIVASFRSGHGSPGIFHKRFYGAAQAVHRGSPLPRRTLSAVTILQFI